MIFGHRFVKPRPRTVIINDLEWQYDDDGIERDWYKAQKYPESLGDRWRLPSIEELISIIDFSRFDPACDSKLRCRSSYYWSSSTNAGYTSDAWYVNFHNGYVGCYYKTGNNYVRCVRPIEKCR